MLSERSKQIRLETLKLSKANGGYHYGPCFSATEILIALYDNVLTDDDRFILSKGHACWPWYVLLREKGLNPRLTGHPTRDAHNGVLCSTGSLGHGLPTAIGIAMAKKLKGEPGAVYVLMGDGECQEGTTWESMLIAAKHKVNNLVVIIDRNQLQGSGNTSEILPIQYLEGIARFIGWGVKNINGHSIEEITEAVKDYKDFPLMVVADTVKGKGVSFMENKPEWHAKWPTPDEESAIISELINDSELFDGGCDVDREGTFTLDKGEKVVNNA